MIDTKPSEFPVPKGTCECGRGNKVIARYGNICRVCHAEGWRAGKDMMVAIGKDKTLKTDNSVEQLLEILPPYIHLDEETNRLYFILTRDISGKWLAAYWTEEKFYHAVTEDTPKQALNALNNSLKEKMQ